MHIHSQRVIDTFFQTFYHERIQIAKEVGQHYHKQLDTSLLTFWFSVIDFYGGLYYIGKNNQKQTYGGGGRLKLANKDSFKLFITDFFPAPENELGEFLYTVFRSGLVHQLSPKKGEIIWDASNPKLLWLKINSAEPKNTANKVATINIHHLEHLAFGAYEEFRKMIESDNLVAECRNICSHLLDIEDGLEDGATIHHQYMNLSNNLQAYITI